MMNGLTEITYAWRGVVADVELFELTVAHGGSPAAGWWDRIRPHSLGWVTARVAGEPLTGFVNVAWDGCDHAFLLDPKVRPDHQHQGVGANLVALAARHARDAGCEWLHVDFRDELASFYFEACGFAPIAAGVIRLVDLPDDGGADQAS